MPGGLVPLITNSGATSGLYAPAGAGGGGGGGANPIVSSLTVNPNGAISFPNGVSSFANASIVGYMDFANTSTMSFNVSQIAGYTNLNGSSAVWTVVSATPGGGAYYGDMAAGRLAVIGNVGGIGVTPPVVSSDGNGGLDLQSVSSVNISSASLFWNGAPISGGGGANPVVSSLTVAYTGEITFLNDNTLASSGLSYNIDAAGTSTLNFGISYVNDETGGGGGIGLGNVLVAGNTNISGYQNLGANKLFLNTGYGNTPGAVLMNDPTAPGTAYVSSLRVSSLNGAIPGGGGGAPPAIVSTISSLVNVSTINVGSPGLLTIAGGVSVLDYVGVGSISTGSIVSVVPGGAVSVPSLGTSSITSAAPQINITVPTSVSSLVVSSINGAAPGGGGSLQFSTLSIPQGPGISTFVCNPGTNLLVSFSTTAGHVYSATVQARAQSFDPAANGDILISEILDNNAGNDFIGSWPLQSISTQTAAGAYQMIGGSVTWKAGGTGASFSVVPNLSSFIRVDGINVIDFGAI